DLENRAETVDLEDVPHRSLEVREGYVPLPCLQFLRRGEQPPQPRAADIGEVLEVDDELLLPRLHEAAEFLFDLRGCDGIHPSGNRDDGPTVLFLCSEVHAASRSCSGPGTLPVPGSSFLKINCPHVTL